MLPKRFALSTYAQFLTLPFVLIVIVILLSSLSNYDDKRSEKDLVAEQALIEKYAIQCYASEGSYPPDLQYLEENYGLILNYDSYVYFYEVFASNVLPDIRVVNKSQGNP